LFVLSARESSGAITKTVMTMTHAFSANEGARNYSLTALALLADPVSTLLDRSRLAAIALIALRQDEPTSRGELALLLDCARALGRLRPPLKRVITALFESGAIDAPTTQRIVDRFEIWSD
jgi:hypothetical protein